MWVELARGGWSENWVMCKVMEHVGSQPECNTYMCGFNDVNKNSIYIRFHCSTDAQEHVHSFTGKANYYVTHVVQKKKCCVLQENVVSKQLTLYDQETTDQYVVVCKVLTNKVAFSIVPAAQYCSVARDGVN